MPPSWFGWWGTARMRQYCAAVLLTAAGDDPASAGQVLLAYKRVFIRKPALSSKAVAELADLLRLAWDDRLAAVIDHADDAL